MSSSDKLLGFVVEPGAKLIAWEDRRELAFKITAHFICGSLKASEDPASLCGGAVNGR
jgi:hypothetical protein